MAWKDAATNVIAGVRSLDISDDQSPASVVDGSAWQRLDGVKEEDRCERKMVSRLYEIGCNGGE